ncbi:lactadherin-like [Lytechinus variegatus]|uniref:lactadherin-like n=1 Tax=Lytechinus variegatus TaxID=7654 RepID=UPI001BB1234C|nr:lactadherin-like [Lytechinus variegatus]
MFIRAIKFHEGRFSERLLAFATNSNPTKYMRIHQEHWTSSSSHLVCQYLGFGGVYATVGGEENGTAFPEGVTETASVVCLPDATDITDCWQSGEPKHGRVDESVAVVCCPVSRCNPPGHPLGLESGAVPDSAITASGCLSPRVCSHEARLNGESAWLPSGNYDVNQWLEIKFESIFIITAIVTQGKPKSTRHVTSFTVASSRDSIHWDYYMNNDDIQAFAGNYDSDSPVTHVFEIPLLARLVRIQPRTASVYLMYKIMMGGLRVELLGFGPLSNTTASMNIKGQVGCRTLSGEGLGVEDGRVPDSSMTASSVAKPGTEAHHGRLNHMATNTSLGAWLPDETKIGKENAWIKVDLGEVMLVTGVVTQGQAELNHFVISYDISYSLDNVDWFYPSEEDCDWSKPYNGNYDNITLSTTLFQRPFKARYVRFHPFQYHTAMAMRIEVLGMTEHGSE